MRAWFIAGLLLLVPSAASLSGLIFGTEELPELPDAEGDVGVQPGYTGPSDFLDLTAAWFEHVEKTDEILFTLRVNSTERLGEAPLGFKVGCYIDGEVTRDGFAVGNLSFGWRQHETRSTMNHWVIWTEASSALTVGGFFLPYEFILESGTPGYFRFSIPRHEITKLGDDFVNPVGGCNGFIDPGGPSSAPNNFAGITLAYDDAASQAIYSFRDLRQSRTAAGEVLDPVERFERENATAVPSSETTTKAGGTPALGIIGFLVAAAAAIIVRRRS